MKNLEEKIAHKVKPGPKSIVNHCIYLCLNIQIDVEKSKEKEITRKQNKIDKLKTDFNKIMDKEASNPLTIKKLARVRK